MKESEEKHRKKVQKANKEHNRENLMVIDMETNDEDEGIEQLKINKEIGFSRANPQSEAHKSNKMSICKCSKCEKSFRTGEDLVNHQEMHVFNCLTCDETFQNDGKLQDHVKEVHDELICHIQCDSGQ